MVNSEEVKNATAVVSEKSQKAWGDITKKSDELGVTKAFDTAGTKIKQGALVVGAVATVGFEKVGSAIDSNAVLKDAKQKTYNGMAAAGSYIGKTFGSWFGSTAKKPEQPVVEEQSEEESKVE